MSEFQSAKANLRNQNSIPEEFVERAHHVGFQKNYNAKYDFDSLPSCLTDPINLKKWPFESGNISSPTPLDPYNVSCEGKPYVSEAFGFIYEKLKKRVDSMGLKDEGVIEAITDEIGNRHLLQCERNEQSFYRLCAAIEADPSRFTPDLDVVIRRVRSAEANSEERILLLATFPEILAIEDMKISCVFEEETYQSEMTKYTQKLFINQLAPNATYKMRSLPRGTGPQTKIKDVSDNASENILVSKGEYAVIESKGVDIGLVERKSHYVLSDDVRYKGMQPRLITFPNGKRVNIQTLFGGTYLKVE